VGEAGHESFDPGRLARAELGWWEARRDLRTASPAVVGSHIAQLYAAAYGVSADQVLEAAVLRAKAAALRDEGSTTGDDAYWAEVEVLLHRSYRTLQTEVADVSDSPTPTRATGR
jgi:hypothetical protein